MCLHTTEASPASRPRARCIRRERGVVLLWAAISVILIASLILAGFEDMVAVTEVTRSQFSAEAQATEIAHAGLTDAIAWFRRQSKQPVTDFAPQLNLNKPVPVNETEDPSQGLVRTYEISAGLWGRYIVRRGVPAEPFDDANASGYFDAGESFTDVNGDGRWTPHQYARDVSSERGLSSRGGAWYVISEGHVYRRPRADLPLGQGENVLIASARVATELRRMTLKLPASAAVAVMRGNQVSVGTRARVSASKGTAVAHASGSGPPGLTGSEVRGPTSGVSKFKADVQDVFGMTWDELRAIADVSGRDVPGALPDRVADHTLHVVAGDVTYDATRPLVGKGIVVVQGNCTIAEGSSSLFEGLLYVSGDLTARAPARLTGQAIVLGQLDVRGTGSDYVEFHHDPDLVDRLMTRIGQYRFIKATFPPLPWLPDGRPTERHRSARRLGASESGLATPVE